MFKKPLVSILIASYNKEKLVRRCINSCLSQTYKNFEIIFVDNDSLDKSFEIAKKFKNVRAFIKKRKKYKSFKFNTFYQLDTYIFAYKKSRGSILCFLDSDDFYKKNKLKEIVNFFLKNKNKNIVFDKPLIFYSKKKNYKSHDFDQFNDRKNLWPKFPPQSCISIRKSFFKKIINEIKFKKFPLLTLDFRLATLSKCIYKDFNIINKFLTYYFQDLSGESYSKFKKFNINWWSRRFEAHSYLKYILKKYKKKYVKNFDYYITSIINLFFNIFRFN